MTARLHKILRSTVAACALWAGHAQAFTYDFLTSVTVVEMYNARLDHYFLTHDAQEIAAIEAGNAGPGWSRTGFGFKARALRDPTNCLQPYCPPPVHRVFRPAQGAVTASRYPSGYSFRSLIDPSTMMTSGSSAGSSAAMRSP